MTDATTPLASVPWLDPGMVDTLALADVHTVGELAKGAALTLAPIGWPAGAIAAAQWLRDGLDDGPPPLDPTTPLERLIEWFPDPGGRAFQRGRAGHPGRGSDGGRLGRRSHLSGMARTGGSWPGGAVTSRTDGYALGTARTRIASG